MKNIKNILLKTLMSITLLDGAANSVYAADNLSLKGIKNPNFRIIQENFGNCTKVTNDKKPFGNSSGDSNIYYTSNGLYKEIFDGSVKYFKWDKSNARYIPCSKEIFFEGTKDCSSR